MLQASVRTKNQLLGFTISTLMWREGIIAHEHTSHSCNIKALNWYADQTLIFFLVDLTPELVLKTPNSSTQGRLRWIGNKPLESQVFMLDAWKVCSYTIIPFYLPRILVNNEEIYYNDAGGEVESLYALKLSQPLDCLLTIFYPGLHAGMECCSKSFLVLNLY